MQCSWLYDTSVDEPSSGFSNWMLEGLLSLPLVNTEKSTHQRQYCYNASMMPAARDTDATTAASQNGKKTNSVSTIIVVGEDHCDENSFIVIRDNHRTNEELRESSSRDHEMPFSSSDASCTDSSATIASAEHSV